MNAFVSWHNKPFDPRRASRPTRRGTRTVTIRYRGSFARSAIKALIVLTLLAITSGGIGERTSRSADASEVASGVGSAGTRR